ncbi:metal-sensitive transcriptional regulator [Cellulomonas sp. P24]|jgi:DNA-binding FrmR family transcriptional regulator|uniref:metal-sensitive transcriptional regulator n=1 Tax=Cellulomonas sp. P24 TaxID=2885206 RepID=UPI00216AC0E7|nr:metal-sensitive transcriptional regulator [Cellulomonas sp. P24]
MEMDPEEMARVVNRLRRTQGQVGGVVRMLEEGRTCEDIITQLAAVSRALDRTGFALTASGLRQCLADSGGTETTDTLKLEKVFLSLA